MDLSTVTVNEDQTQKGRPMKSLLQSLKRGISSPWSLLALLVVASFAYRIATAREADLHSKPYKYELIEEFQGTRIIHGIIDPSLDAHQVFIEKDGEKTPVTVFLLADYVNRKYAGETVDRKIGHFVRLFNPYPAKIIESVTDIPGYAPDQLDPDIRPDAIKTWRFTLKRGRLDRVHPRDCIVKYAWEHMGELQRFRFQVYGTTNEIWPHEVAVMQTQVGDHGALD